MNFHPKCALYSNQKAFNHLDNYIIIYYPNNLWVQGCFNEAEAQRVVDILNKHEVENNRAPEYTYINKSAITQVLPN